MKTVTPIRELSQGEELMHLVRKLSVDGQKRILLALRDYLENGGGLAEVLERHGVKVPESAKGGAA